MAKIVFFLTDMQLKVLRVAAAGGATPHDLHRAFYTLRSKGLVDGSIWGNEGATLTPIGRKALAVIDALEKRARARS